MVGAPEGDELKELVKQISAEGANYISLPDINPTWLAKLSDIEKKNANKSEETCGKPGCST